MLVLDRMNEDELLRDARQLRDEELLAGLDRLLRDDRALTVQLIVHIGEVDARGLYREQAHASMFEYAVETLHMSESEAYTRIRAARLCREFPVVLRMLARGELHLSAVKLLAPVLTADNCDELLRAARFKSKRQVELVLAQRFPKPDVRSEIRKLPAKPSTAVPAAAVSGALQLASVALPENSNSTLRSEPAGRREPAPSLQLAPTVPEIAPLRTERYKVQFTANQRLHDKIAQAQDLLRHQVPVGDLAAVVERALDLLIAERMKQRFAQVRRPRTTTRTKPSKPDSRHIPHGVRRDVIERDGLQCTFRSADGKRCEQRGLLQLHHEQPYGRGGPATTANIHVLCRAHNQLLAEHDYGRTHVQKRVAEARAQRPPARSSRRSRSESTEPLAAYSRADHRRRSMQALDIKCAARSPSRPGNSR
jgi:5-methylcytosine-specific restriction endonuclease McrA